MAAAFPRNVRSAAALREHCKKQGIGENAFRVLLDCIAAAQPLAQ